mgnify:CR=1 FL=1
MSNEHNDFVLESYFQHFKDNKKPDGTEFSDEQCELYAKFRFENEGGHLTPEQFLEINKLDPAFPKELLNASLEEVEKDFGVS